MPGSLHRIDGYDCPLCLNKGYSVEVADSGGSCEVIQRTCRCMSLRRTLRALRENGLDKAIAHYTLEKFIPEQPWQRSILDLARGYLDVWGETPLGNRDAFEQPWFFFGGQSGCGKSHICTALVVELLRRGITVHYMMWRDEATRLKVSLNEGGYTEAVKRLKKVPLLYIDDLFKTGRGEGQRRQRPTSADVNLAFEILNARYNDHLPTIISSESLLPEIAGFDDSIAGRIRERCGGFLINLSQAPERNYRMRQRGS